MPVFELALLFVWAALLFGGFVAGWTGGRRMPRWTRLGSSLVLVVAAWGSALATPHGPLFTFALLIATGMTLGFIGDLFMAGVIPLRERFIGGMASFGLGHIAYIAAGVGLGNALGLSPVTRLVAWLAWLVVGAVGWYFALVRGSAPAALRWIALPYALLLASTAGVATGLALQRTALLPFAVGAALFLLSDLLIAAQVFARRELRGRLKMDDLIWLTYGPGQMLIVYTLPFALAASALLPSLNF